MKLYMIMIGCKPKGRFTEQHDIFFGIANSLKDLIPEMKSFWPEAKGKIHLDAWREVTNVDNYSIEVVNKDTANHSNQLFFINLGGYKENEFDEFHYKILTVGKTLAEATKKSKETAFYKHFGFKGATSHIDDKYGIDIDDTYNVKNILNEKYKNLFSLKIVKSEIVLPEDKLHIGYFKLDSI
jgi:hypothetical protein